MARTALLVVLGIALLSASAEELPTAEPVNNNNNKGLCLLQQKTLSTKVIPDEDEAEEDDTAESKAALPPDSPVVVDPPAHGGGEGETLAEKEKALAELAKAEGSGAVAAEATHVLSELSQGQDVPESELQKLEATVATQHQSQETLAANGALLTVDDLSDVHGQRVEEMGAGDEPGPFFEGDILPSGPEQLALLQELSKAQANGTLSRWVGAGRPWTGGRVPYCFSPDVSQVVKDIFRGAVGVIHDNLRCLTFEEVDCIKGTSLSKERWESNFDPEGEAECAETPAVFVKSNPNFGCFSALGMVTSWKSQSLQLQEPGCTHMGITIHEIGHALGMHHEHQRKDRDDAITIDLDNVQPDARAWFATADNVYSDQPYDILSIMHYGAFAFAEDRSKPTITDKAGGHANIGARGSLAESDAEQLEEMYKEVVDTCAVNPRTGSGCEDISDSCEGLTECGQAARGNCCACGGGREVQCFGDKPCKAYTALTGKSAPFLGWLSGGGTIGGWWHGTVEKGLEKCEEEEGCVGITLNVDANTARSGAHWMMLKNHFKCGGGDTSGWTSFKVTPPPTPAPATPEPTPAPETPEPTPAPTPAPTPKPTQKSARSGGGGGGSRRRRPRQSRQQSRPRRGRRSMLLQAGHYIVGGGEMYGGSKYVTLSEAETMCESDPECRGFTWSGGPTPPSEGPALVFFANKTRHFAGPGWNSFVKV